jgi:hypothetical protein
MQIRFYINKALLESMAEEEYEAIEMAQEGEVKLYRLRPLMARFMVDENRKPLSHDLAKKILGKVPLGEFSSVTMQFVDAFKELAVPNGSRSLSESPLSATSQAPSPAGS